MKRVNDFPNDVMILFSILIVNGLSNLWQQLDKLASELESELWEALDVGSKWLNNFNARKVYLVSFNCSNKYGAIDVKMDGSAFD